MRPKGRCSAFSMPSALPALLFTASHGMTSQGRVSHKQLAEQGGLLCQDWPGYGAVRAEHYLVAADVPESANVHGMVAFLFACFGAGTPATRPIRARFRGDQTRRRLLAPQPFVAALPQRLLSHPRRRRVGRYRPCGSGLWLLDPATQSHGRANPTVPQQPGLHSWRRSRWAGTDDAIWPTLCNTFSATAFVGVADGAR